MIKTYEGWIECRKRVKVRVEAKTMSEAKSFAKSGEYKVIDNKPMVRWLSESSFCMMDSKGNPLKMPRRGAKQKKHNDDRNFVVLDSDGNIEEVDDYEDDLGDYDFNKYENEDD